MPVNRIVAIATVVLSLLAAALPAVANFDWTSTAGVIAGIAGMATVVLKWLDGWQAHEQQQHWDQAAILVSEHDDSATLPS